jgi:hypothetical protein
MGRGETLAALALRRVGALLSAELRASADETELLLVCARGVLEAWLTGHAALLLGEEGLRELERRERFLGAVTDPRAAADLDALGRPVTLLDLARRLDRHVYGVTERPKAFQRHLASFFEEIDIAGAEGTAAMLDAFVREAAGGARRRADVLRVSLWVGLFLARYYFDATAEPDRASRAYELFQRLRDATDAFYEQRALG